MTILYDFEKQQLGFSWKVIVCAKFEKLFVFEKGIKFF